MILYSSQVEWKSFDYRYFERIWPIHEFGHRWSCRARQVRTSHEPDWNGRRSRQQRYHDRGARKGLVRLSLTCSSATQSPRLSVTITHICCQVCKLKTPPLLLSMFVLRFKENKKNIHSIDAVNMRRSILAFFVCICSSDIRAFFFYGACYRLFVSSCDFLFSITHLSNLHSIQKKILPCLK